jgi:biopolymer transport protein ExbD
MRFTNGRRRAPPAIIIVSLIDILIVLLIFMMVTTTFKRKPALKLTLPESKQAKPGQADPGIVLSVTTNDPYFYLEEQPVRWDDLGRLLVARARTKPGATVTIDADEAATLKNVLRAFEAAKEAKFDRVSISGRTPGGVR